MTRAKNAPDQGEFQEALTANQYLMIQAIIFFKEINVWRSGITRSRELTM